MHGLEDERFGLLEGEDVVLVVPVFAKQRGTRAGYLLGLDDGQETHKLVGSIVHLASGKTYRVDSGPGRVSFEINQALKGDV